jgi:hypothetical protein
MHVEKHFKENIEKPSQYQTPNSGIFGYFLKWTHEMKGVGHDWIYIVEPCVQEVGSMYGKLNANTVIVHMPTS